MAAVLMNEAERQVRANGYQMAWLAVVAGNARARAFYERAGWQDEGAFDYAASAETGRSSSRPAVTQRASAGQAHRPDKLN